MTVDPAIFIRDNTILQAPPLVPEIALHLATEVVPLWRKTEEELEAHGVPPPYWAFAWAGGQALARYVLDNSELVSGARVLDFGSGSGLLSVAAAKAGAAHVLAADIDHFATTAIALNCEANNVAVEVTNRDVIGAACAWDTILVGDMCYERPLAERLLAWLTECARGGATALPGVTRLQTYNVQTTRELEDREIRETSVYRLTPDIRPGAGPT
jgi:predicted nicotinamide N-methyase